MRELARWHGGLAGSLLASAVGLYVGNYAFFVVATIPLVYVVYGYVTGLGPPSLAVERRLSDDHTDPGDPVTVEVTVTNVGDRPIPDLRLVDAVPENVAVVDGSPAAGVALRPGESATVSYDVLPPRGTHEFGDVTVRGRSVAGTVVGTTRLEPAGASTVTCDTLLDEFPLRDETIRLTGQHPTDVGGDGTAFYAVREYRRGDPLGRIDWRRLARTGELGTVTYREERAAAIVFVIDDRPPATVRPPQGGPSATDYAVYAAAQGLVTLTDDGHRVGVTTLTGADAGDWVEPGHGDVTRAAATDLFDRLQGRDADDADPETPHSRPVAADGFGMGIDTDPDGTAFGLDLTTRLPRDAQVVLCSPLVDDAPVAVAETVLSNGHALTVLSPSVTVPTDGGPTPGQATADLGRRTRLTDLQRLGVPVTDWSPTTPLQVALADTIGAHRRRWQR